MRALFSLVGLLVVVVVIVMVARKQLQAVAPSVVPPAASSSSGGAAPTIQEQSRSVQQKVLQDVGRALEQGAQRASESQP
jgi:hypothetical protein